MYKFKDNQLSLRDFGAAVGLKLNPENWWIKKARSIPWEEIEARYAKLFANRKGNVAKPLRLALGACIIQAEYGYSDEEITLQIQEGAYLQYFCGYGEYDDSKPPFDPSLMVYFRKRLTPEILGEINELIIMKAQPLKPERQKDDDSDDQDSRNGGTMIVDATCAPSNIKYPQDTVNPANVLKSSLMRCIRPASLSRAHIGKRHAGNIASLPGAGKGPPPLYARLSGSNSVIFQEIWHI